MPLDEGSFPAALGETQDDGGPGQTRPDDHGGWGRRARTPAASVPGRQLAIPKPGLRAGRRDESRADNLLALRLRKSKCREGRFRRRQTPKDAERKSGRRARAGNRRRDKKGVHLGLDLRGEGLRGSEAESENNASVVEFQPMKPGNAQGPLRPEKPGEFRQPWCPLLVLSQRIRTERMFLKSKKMEAPGSGGIRSPGCPGAEEGDPCAERGLKHDKWIPVLPALGKGGSREEKRGVHAPGSFLGPVL